MKITKRLRFGSLLAIALTITAFCLAQQKSISGRVVDASNSPMPGVTVSVKNKNTVTTTNEKGEFSIPAATDDVLVFTSVGYTPFEERVRTSVNMTITLSSLLANNLNEVVVVGYGTTRKRDLTGSVATVTASNFQKGQIATPEQMIAGKIPGVSIISNGGRPGAGSVIRIRGGSSLRASNDPLIVIDGVPLDNNAIPGSSDPLSFINSNDIESFTVLKDASAAAIYGTRASNGVLIIT
ncbi:MAG TPA: TonB-dependent receptor plug domain-containing protein, partial [Niastella sp.]